MNVNRVERIWMKPNDTIGELCHLSKNLYNQGNYLVRQSLLKNSKWMRYVKLYDELKLSSNYKELPSQTAQQTLKLVDKNWTSYFKSHKEWKRHPEKFYSEPKLPKYLDKDGQYILKFTNQQTYIENGKVKFPKVIDLDITTRLSDDTDLQEVRIVPKGVGYVMEIVYGKEVPKVKGKPKRICGIDIGSTNLVAIGNNIGLKPIVIKAGVAKSINQYYNKERARLDSVYAKHKIGWGISGQKLTNKRYRKVTDCFHKTSRLVIDWCLQNKIDTIVIGHNEDWKQNINLGTRTNQNFVQLPFNMLIEQIEYKGEDAGIKVIIQEESHTSKCSFLDNESVKHHKKYKGKRFQRGLFRSMKGTVINADINAAYNIIKKAIPKAFKREMWDGIEGVALHPEVLHYV